MADGVTIPATSPASAAIHTRERTIGGALKHVERVQQTPEISRITANAITVTAATTNYTVGDSIGSLITFATVTSFSDYFQCKVTGVQARFGSLFAAGDACSLWLFHTSPTTVADNAAWAPSNADLDKVIGVVDLPIVATRRFTTGPRSLIAVDCDLDIDGLTTQNIVAVLRLETLATPGFFAATTDVSLALMVDKL